MSDGYKIFWDGVKKELEGLLSSNDVDVWISRIDFYEFDTNKKILRLSVPTLFIKDRVIKFKEQISSIFSSISGLSSSVEFVVIQPTETKNEESRGDLTSDKKKMLDNEEQDKKQKQNFSGNKITFNTVEQSENFSFDSFVIGSSNEFAAHAARIVAENPGTQYNPYFVWATGAR